MRSVAIRWNWWIERGIIVRFIPETSMPVRPYDETLLRQSFAVAKRSRDGGDHPFGSLLADKHGKVLREQGNGYSSEGGDRTAHAEKLLASWAAKNLSLEELQECTLYTSAEPCAMCSGAIYWAGIGRVVFGQTEKNLKAQTGDHEEDRRTAAGRGSRAAAGGFLGREGLTPRIVALSNRKSLQLPESAPG
jgi:tRNA(Arg) A34 adenosine deaminase TadA